MNPLDLISPISAIISKVLDFIPDPAAKLAASVQLQTETIAFATQMAQAQASVNTEEAKSGSLFVAGARPFILWVCGASIGYTYILQPLLTSILKALVFTYVPPSLDSGSLMALVTGMLGLAASHVVENVQSNNNAAATAQAAIPAAPAPAPVVRVSNDPQYRPGDATHG